MKSQEIRRIFLDYFADHGHEIISSSSLLPSNDPTLFFVNAGMVQFKDLFTGKEQANYSRATSVQRCLRVSGKHNDLEEVGRTARHHTLFEMLGNFSFGDYFKRDAIRHAWTLLTDEKYFGLDKNRLWVTIFEEDDEAGEIWRELTDVAPERIQKLGAKDNFWSMGDTGPCGPCTEIHYDHGPEYGADPNGPAGETDRYVEIWNLVFMQFERDADGNVSPLPNPSIDTGMGLERLAAIKQGVYNNYDTDIFQSVIAQCSQWAGVQYQESADINMALRVIADHSRSVAFLIGDGVIPSNEGRGYVLRRIARRAIRYGVKLGLDTLFLHKAVNIIIDEMSEAYPFLSEKRAFILEVTEAEEERFRATLDKGLIILEEAFENIGENRCLDGDIAFQLHDTFGFPLDLTRLIASEKGFYIDEAGYLERMNEQKEAGRKNWKGAGSSDTQAHTASLADIPETQFEGYTETKTDATILALLDENRERVTALSGHGFAILDRTPFYAESGGQVGDTGSLFQDSSLVATVVDTQKSGSLFLHELQLQEGTLSVGSSVLAQIDQEKRLLSRRNHTATHILHSALRKVLGNHVTQKGSLVEPGRLRFDFSHHKPVSEEEIKEITHLVQEQIIANHRLAVEVCDIESAKEKGAMALFGEKYGKEVRVVSIPNFSIELCGGTHVPQTGEIGLFSITSETGISAGIRRIEALTSTGALSWMEERSQTVEKIAGLLNSPISNLVENIEKNIQLRKNLEKEIAALKKKLAQAESGDLLSQKKVINGIQIISAEFPGEVGAMREETDRLRDKLGSGVVVLGSKEKGVKLIVAVTKDLAGKKVHAGKLIKELAPLIGGGGGGRPDMAQAGGKNPDGLEAALEKVLELL